MRVDSEYRDTKWKSRSLCGSCKLRNWPIDRGSLTQRIKDRCKNFRVELVRQELSPAFTDELEAIAYAPKRWALVREVYLYCDDTPVVFAHTVFGVRSSRGAWQSLSRLGNRSLGAALFSNPKVKRQPLHFKSLNAGNKLYHLACTRLQAKPSRLQARRSLFILTGEPLLVTEVFLPGIAKIKL